MPASFYSPILKVRRLVSLVFQPILRAPQVKTVGGQPTGLADECMFAVLQGLVNRHEPVIYLNFRCINWGGFNTSPELPWLAYYEKRFGIPVQRLRDPEQLLKMFSDHVRGVVLYDPRQPNTMNPAVMVCGRQNAVPVTATQQRDLRRRYGWAAIVVDDFRGRFANDFEINRWSHRLLQPGTHRHVIAHQPGFVPYLYDFVIAKNVFLFCGSHSMKDRREAALADKIYQAAGRPCHVMGWLDGRTQELEYAARTARNGCFITCNGRAPNLTIHAGIDAAPQYRPRQLTTAQKTAKRKVYVTLVRSDGDALWCLNNFFSDTFRKSWRGKIPLNWEFQMLAYHLAPGILQYYFEKLTPNDFPLASVSGVGYTYPNLHPDPVGYLKLTDRYLRLTGLRHMYLGLSDPYRAHYWRDRDSDVARLVRLYRKHVPTAAGCIRHYGGGGLWEKHYLKRGQMPVVCATALASRGRDSLRCIPNAIASVDYRPMFLLIHLTPWGPTPGEIQRAVRDLHRQGHEVVLLDEWFAKLNDAVNRGWLKDELYPDRLARLLRKAEEARATWNSHVRAEIDAVLAKCLLPRARLARMHDTFPRIWGAGQPVNERQRTVTRLEDDLAFSVLFTAQVLAAFVAGCRGCYLTDLEELADHFAVDAPVLSECLLAFVNWDKRHYSIRQAQSWARRLRELLPRLSV